jgi:transposase
MERDSTERRYHCEACGDTFESEEALRDHLYSLGLVY